MGVPMGRWEPMLEQLVRERYPRLLSRATFLTGSREDAEDLVQEALVASFSGRARFGSVNEAEAYVRRAITTRSVDRSRTAGHERRAWVRLAGFATSEVVPEPQGLSGDVVAALGVLAPRVRACVALRFLDDLSIRDTADALGLTEGSVKRYTADGIAALNTALGTTASDPEFVSVKEVGRGA
ncbi:sigma-70 family RNA polymerase sigma factor [Cellulomonas biazotea]|uniref:RNA polymerase sigma factor n=1 Tax=Cellulomonas biazotea TaxID=1709 RepID=A0A402DLP4_9CELL|nr:sigma-70 family RNA polymerase sigma factor [Cellulomonas biazotea]GCE75043.1 RNA polymerase sigma factor [Cellulomonas biazotea]